MNWRTVRSPDRCLSSSGIEQVGVVPGQARFDRRDAEVVGHQVDEVHRTRLATLAISVWARGTSGDAPAAKVQVRMGAPHAGQDLEVLGIAVEPFHDTPVADVGEGVVDVGQLIGGQAGRIDQRVPGKR